MNSRQTAISRVVKLMDDFETNNAMADRNRTRLKFAIAQTIQSVGIDEPGSFDAGELELADDVNECLQIMACEMRARRASIRLSEERRRRTLETSVVSVDLPVLSGVGSGGSSSDAGGASEFLEFVVAPVEDAGLQNTQTSGKVDVQSSTYVYHRQRVTTIPEYLKYVLHQKHNMFLRSVEEMDTKKGWEIVLSSPVSYSQVLASARPVSSFHNIMVIPTSTTVNELSVSDFDDAHSEGKLKDITNLIPNSISEGKFYLLDPNSEVSEPKPMGYVYRLSKFDSTTHTRIPFHLQESLPAERKDKSAPYTPNFVELARNKRYNVFSRYSILTTPQDKIQPENEPYLAVRSFVTPPENRYGFMVPLTLEYITTRMSEKNTFILVEHPNTISPSFTASFTYQGAPADTDPVERSFDKFLYSYQEVLNNGMVRQDKIEAVNEGVVNDTMRPSSIQIDQFVFKSKVPRHTFDGETSTTASMPSPNTAVDIGVKNISTTEGVQPVYDAASNKVTFYFDGTTVAQHAEHGTTYEYRVSTIQNTNPVSIINSINAIGTLTKPIPSPAGSVNRSLAFTFSVTGIDTIKASELGTNPAIVDILDLQMDTLDEKVEIETSDVDITRGVPEAAVDPVTGASNASVEYLSFAMDVVHNGIPIPIKDTTYKLGILPINLPSTMNTVFYGSKFYVSLTNSAYVAYLEDKTVSYRDTKITVRAQNREYFDSIQYSNDGFYNKGRFTVSFKPSVFHKTEQKYGTFKVKNKIGFKKLVDHTSGSVTMEDDAANLDGTQTLFRVEPFAEYDDFVTRRGTFLAAPSPSISSTFKMSYHLMFDSIARFPSTKPYTFICGKPSWNIRPSVANFTGGGFGEFFQHKEKTMFRFTSVTANRESPFYPEETETKEHKNGATTFYRMFDGFGYDDYKTNMLSSHDTAQTFKDGMIPLHVNSGKVLGDALQPTDKEYIRTKSVKTSDSGYRHTISKASGSQALHTITEGGETSHLVHKLGAFHTFEEDPASTNKYCFNHRRASVVISPFNINGKFEEITETYEGIYMDRASEHELIQIPLRETSQNSAMLWSHGRTFMDMLNNINNEGGIDAHRFSTNGHAQNRAMLTNMMTLLNGEWTSGSGVHADDNSILNQNGLDDAGAGPILEQLYGVNGVSDVPANYPTVCLPSDVKQNQLQKYIHEIHVDVKSKMEIQASTGPNKTTDDYQRMLFYVADFVTPEHSYVRIKPLQYETGTGVTLPSEPGSWTLASKPVVKQVVYVKKVSDKLVPVSQIFDIQRRDPFEQYASNAGLFGTVVVDGTQVDGGGAVLERIPSLTFDFSTKEFKQHNQSSGSAYGNRGIVSQPVGGGAPLLAAEMDYRTINSVIDVPALNSLEARTLQKHYEGQDFETFGVVLYMEFENTDTRKMGHMVAQGHASVDDAKA